MRLHPSTGFWPPAATWSCLSPAGGANTSRNAVNVPAKSKWMWCSLNRKQTNTLWTHSTSEVHSCKIIYREFLSGPPEPHLSSRPVGQLTSCTSCTSWLTAAGWLGTVSKLLFNWHKKNHQYVFVINWRSSRYSEQRHRKPGSIKCSFVAVLDELENRKHSFLQMYSVKQICEI